MKLAPIHSLSLLILIAMSAPRLAAATQIPYLEAIQMYQEPQPSPSDIQRQIVLLNTQTRLTPDWFEPYRALVDVYSGIGRYDQAKIACDKYASGQSQNADAQRQLVAIDLRRYQTAETRRQYLEAVLRDRQAVLLPEVVADLYYQLAQIAWQNFENDRARKYLEFAIKRFGQDLKAYQMLRTIADADNTTGPAQDMQGEVREFQARVMVNPMDALSALQLAILAGRAGAKDAMGTWAGYAGSIKRTFASTQEWPVNLQLELAESYLGVDQPARTVEILRGLLPQVQRQSPATRPARVAGTFNETRVRLLMILAARKTGDHQTVDEQHVWLDNLTREIQRQPADVPGRLGLVSTFYSVYADPGASGNITQALALAQAAIKIIPDNPKARMALALALARAGECDQARKLFRELNDPTNPLLLFGQALCAAHKNELPAARVLLAKALRVCPYGPLRDVLLATAGQIALENPPAPEVGGTIEAFKKFDPKYLEFPGRYPSACKLTLTAEGDPARGQSVRLSLTLTNTSDIPLVIGHAAIIPPTCLIEVRPQAAQGPAVQGAKLYLHVPILARQVLPPRKSLSFSTLLDEAVSMDGKTGWNDFVANRPGHVTRVTIQPKIFTSVTLTESVELALAAAAPVTVNLPPVNADLAAAVRDKLNEPTLAAPWETARLAQWVLTAAGLKDHQPAVAAGLIDHLRQSTDAETRTALAWTLRFVEKPGPDVINTLAALLKSKYWFTRLMVLDTLGRLQGKAAEKLFQFYAVEDPDNLVRQMAAGYLLY